LRDKSLDEFESIFEKASIPVLDIQEIAIRRVCALVLGGQLDESILALAEYFQDRFHANISICYADSAETDKVLKTAKQKNMVPLQKSFSSMSELVGQLVLQKCDLILAPEPDQVEAGGQCPPYELDTLIEALTPPVLLVRNPMTEPAGTFRRILHSLTGNFQQTQNFEYSFTLVDDENGELMLLHVIDQEEMQGVRNALKLSAEINEKQGDTLLEKMSHQGERYLKGVVAAGRDQPYQVSYRLEIGEVVPTVRRELERQSYTLLVVGRHREGKSYMAADDYQLMRMVKDIPVLAL